MPALLRSLRNWLERVLAGDVALSLLSALRQPLVWLQLRWQQTGLPEKIGPLWERAIAYGTESYPREVRRRLRILNMMCYLIAFSTLTYAVQHLFVDHEAFMPVIVINLLLVIAALAVPFMHRFHETAGGLLIAGAEYAGLFVLTYLLGGQSGVHLQYFVGAAAPFVIFGLGRLPLVLFTVVLGMVLNITASFMFSRLDAMVPADNETLAGIYVGAAITTGGIIAATVYYAFRLAAEAQAQTERVLRAMLPLSIAERLIERPGESISQAWPEATILFTDIVGFTPLAQKLGAEGTVALLGEVFEQIDALIERCQVEKIKTIGDAYMIAAGLPDACPDHCHRLAKFALELPPVVEAIARRRQVEIDVRIGMHTGPVVAGVLGTNRYVYDVWGETVNLAARLETYGKPSRVHVSEAVKQMLGEQFDYYDRGVREMKGVGLQKTYFLFPKGTC